MHRWLQRRKSHPMRGKAHPTLPITRAGLDQRAPIGAYSKNSPKECVMFNKTADPTSAPNTSANRPATGSPSNTRSVLASDLRITGEIVSSGTLEVLGEIDGTLSAKGVIIGAEGRVTGTVTADSIEVKGRLDGKVEAKEFTLRAAAQVAADVSYTHLIIESGATIEGRFSKPKS